MVTLDHGMATAMVQDPRTGLALLPALDDDRRKVRHHRLHAVRAHLQEMAGNAQAAIALWRTAVPLNTSAPQRRYLEARPAAAAT